MDALAAHKSRILLSTHKSSSMIPPFNQGEGWQLMYLKIFLFFSMAATQSQGQFPLTSFCSTCSLTPKEACRYCKQLVNVYKSVRFNINSRGGITHKKELAELVTTGFLNVGGVVFDSPSYVNDVLLDFMKSTHFYLILRSPLAAHKLMDARICFLPRWASIVHTGPV